MLHTFLKTVLFIVFGLAGLTTQAQFVGRISGELVSKEKTASGQFILSVGKFYYDTKIKQIIYQIQFPQMETIVSQDTLLYRFQNKRLVSRIPSFTAPEASIFHLALMGHIRDFGLKSAPYTIQSIEREGNQLFITYKPVAALASFGNIKIAQRNNRLEGVIFFDKKGAILAKQIFRKYVVFNGIDFPQEVLLVANRRGKPYTSLTTYKNLTINDFKDTQHYRVDLPLR